ncbi:long-chain fatty acid transport protein 4 [Nilaparvata lugens]|uniref:long-chain fatty acid transport protein 4 n=1 Tax=Nilaparvata lugens TaxID=108931 RepID=UPI000B983A57|nr:long-chain fatty acid transport protein 4 [Nilaparvata lugens]
MKSDIETIERAASSAPKTNGDLESGLPAGGGNSTTQPDDNGKSASFLKRLLKVIVVTSIGVILLGGFFGTVWYFMGWMFVIQLILVALVAYLAAGRGYKWLYVALRTAPRDLTALSRYLIFLWSVRQLSKKDLSIGEIFRRNATKHPNKVCFIFEDNEWTFAQVEEYSNRVANVFKSHGFRKGDTVALMLENRPEFVCIWLGLCKLGIITALINYNLRKTSLTHSVTVSKCQAFIYGCELTDDVKDIANELAGIKLYVWSADETRVANKELNDKSLTSLLKEVSGTPTAPSEKVNFHDKLLYIYTSGTTGLPKAAVITHARYVFLAGAIGYQVGFKNSDRYYTPLPLYHTAGGAMAIGQALLYGSCVVIRKKFSASGYFSDIIKYKCTIAQYIGEMCRYILATPPKAQDKEHQLRMIFGNGLRPQIWKEFVDRFNIPKVAEFYGATEGNANIANIDNKVGSIGFVSRIIPSIYPISIIRIEPETGEPLRNKDGLCITCNPGEPGVFIGKIIPSNPARAFLGYVNEKESQKKIVTDVFAKGDSAFLSGDILVMDEYGYLFFKDRTGDTFRWKGENVSTSEVEGIVSNLANYRDCVVYGVEVTGSEGRAGMVAIVDQNNTLDLEALAEGAKKSLPSYARPMFIRVLHEVEMTGTYKMKKADLQKEAYNPQVVKDKLFYLSSKGVYEPLTEDIYSQIETGKIRL